MKTRIFLGLLCFVAMGCNNGELEQAKAEAEKAKLEAELAKVKAEAETAKAQAETERKTRELSEELANRERNAVAEGHAQAQELAKVRAESDGVEVSPKVTVTVAERKTDGKPWDAMGGAPDLVVLLSSNQKSFQSGVATDRFNATLQLAPIKLKKGDIVKIVLVDKDMAQSDPIGNATVTFQGPGKSMRLNGLNGSIQF